ncbi:hypothetical protein [Paracoccus salsus]|uniref:hypothetical protein n=1 Tax=Paracoccus salsus TaxID=2911061 RepID=UPI001F1BBAE8|nr:hypothetical protein [Paracoccus salsus]MCF3973962.1 hypothetical protein [Paracoccus salsus]
MNKKSSVARTPEPVRWTMTPDIREQAVIRWNGANNRRQPIPLKTSSCTPI